MDESELNEVKELIDDKDLEKLLSQVDEVRKVFEKAHFNIFSLMSDQYRKENLHSDILAEFLNPEGLHGQGNIFLLEFIKLINKKAKDQKKPELNESCFKNSKVTREKGRIDILIEGEGETIIFESKIKDAGDTDRQLPVYYNRMQKKKGEAENIVIVYMPKIPGKLPSETNWNDQDKKNVYDRLVIFNAFETGKEDLREGLIESWLKIATVHNATILYQYSELLKMIGGLTMEEKLEERIIEYFLIEDLEGKRLSKIYSIYKLANEFFLRAVGNRITNNIKNIIKELKLKENKTVGSDIRPPGGGFLNNNLIYQIAIQNFRYREVDLIIYIRLYLSKSGLSSTIFFQTYDEKDSQKTNDAMSDIMKYIKEYDKDIEMKSDQNKPWLRTKDFNEKNTYEQVNNFIEKLLKAINKVNI
jgi:hypothetical protein